MLVGMLKGEILSGGDIGDSGDNEPDGFEFIDIELAFKQCVLTLKMELLLLLLLVTLVVLLD